MSTEIAPHAVISFREKGPIKTMAGLRAAQVHNSRLEPLPHAEPGRPDPQHLIGTGHLERDARRLLVAAGLNPDRPRKNGVLAFEAVLTASPEFFEEGASQDRDERLARWIEAQTAWAMKRYGPHRIVSLVLHLDEKTPHMHLIVLPLLCKSDGRRRDRAVRWSLVGRSISGPGRYDEVQTHYAEAMKPFGLRRGEVDSGQKHRPVRAYLANLDARMREADQRLAEAEAAKREADDAAAAMAAERAKLAAEGRALAADRVRLDRDRLAARMERKALAREQDDVLRAGELAAARLADINAAKMAANESLAHTEKRRTLLDAHFAALKPTFQLAATFRSKLNAVTGQQLASTAAAALEALAALEAVAMTVEASIAEKRPELAAAYAALRQKAAGR